MTVDEILAFVAAGPSARSWARAGQTGPSTRATVERLLSDGYERAVTQHRGRGA